MPPKKVLKLRQKAQIGIRKCTDKKVRWTLPLSFAVLFFALMLVTSQIPYPTQTAYAADYENPSVQLTFTGDTVLSRYIQTLADVNGYDSLFEDVKEVWANSDYVFTNLEYAVLVNDESEYTEVDKKVTLSGTTESISALLDAGFNVFSYANNHTSDYGTSAFLDAISWMYQNGLNLSGYYLRTENLPIYEEDEPLLTMFEESQEAQYLTLTCDSGLTIGFLAVVDPASSASSLTDYALKSSNPELYAYVNDSASMNDLTIVYIHSGTENAYTPDEDQEELAHSLIDAGADIVIGMHSHTIQPIELYGNGIIFYSIGNFIMDQTQTYNRDSVIVQYNMDETGGYFELIPLRINNGYTQITASNYYINRINRTLTKWLSSDTYYIDEDSGHVIIPWAKS